MPARNLILSQNLHRFDGHPHFRLLSENPFSRLNRHQSETARLLAFLPLQW